MKKPLNSNPTTLSSCVHFCPLEAQCPYHDNGLTAGITDVRVNSPLLSFPCIQGLPPKLVGIPTMDGMEFLKVEDIIRCEGLRQFTKVHIKSEAIISSYNIGEFVRLLDPYGFFAPHKSHLINLQYLRSYHIGGTITLCDGACVPLARRRKEAFLRRIRHI
ncbi:MAG: LytTR family transcriptional regulator [Saprospiraceae bacterium]|nr:LytTR family transcriptional regulator [Saprospiraceae bacterium]